MIYNSLPENITTVVAQALQEDIGSGDITAELIPAQRQAVAQVIVREEAIICGCAWFEAVFQQLQPDTTQINWAVTDGQAVHINQLICEIKGLARTLVTGERTALNFLQLLSATATQTKRYARLIRHTKAVILDTRKTLPNLRQAQKYAVVCAGGRNHRFGLYDAFLIKENHIAAAGGIKAAIAQARAISTSAVNIEVENLAQVQQALAAGADSLLLDNFDLDMLREAVQIVDGRAKLEASGGINLNNIQAIAETGVDFISVGAITKDVKAVDLSMRITSVI